MRHIILVALALALTGVSPASAATCSGWKAKCESRGGGGSCEAKFAKCMKTGTWTEGPAFGGGTHSGIAKK